MGNLGKLFADNALQSLKNTVKVANDMLQSFSLTDISKAMEEAQTRLKNELVHFIGQVKNFTDKYTIEVPFNPQNETISYSIEGNSVYITVKAKDDSSNLNKVVDLPEDVNANEMDHSYDAERHIMTFKFKKA